MKKLLLVFLLLAANAIAAPFVVSDPVDPAVTQCGVFIDATAKQVIPVTVVGTSKICKYDLAGITVGSHTVTMTAITVNDPVWGSQESVKSSPLAFAKPAIPVQPAGLGLSP